MADLFVNTDRLAEAYYYLSKFSEYENSISDYQQNIKTAFLGCINNQELAALLTKASDCLSRSQERCQAVMKGIDSINSVCEWCNEESKALAASVESPSSSQSAIAVSPEVSSAKDFLTGVKTAVGVVCGIKELIEEVPTYRVAKLGIEKSLAVLSDLRITKHYENGKVFLSGYKKSDHLTWRYHKDTFVSKQATNFSFLNKVELVAGAAENAFSTGQAIYNTWNDESKTTEEKIIDTATYGFCSAASMALDVAAVVAGNAVVAAIPIPVVNVLVGSAVEFVVGTMAETMRSEAVVNQVGASIENVVGAAKAGVAVVSKATENLKKSETVGDAIVNTAALVGSAVVAGVQVVGTAIVEGVKTAATVVVETVKNVGKKIANFFKGW